MSNEHARRARIVSKLREYNFGMAADEIESLASRLGTLTADHDLCVKRCKDFEAVVESRNEVLKVTDLNLRQQGDEIERLQSRLDVIRDHADQMRVNFDAPDATQETVMQWMDEGITELRKLCSVEKQEIKS